jgi:hypothetical protein
MLYFLPLPIHRFCGGGRKIKVSDFRRVIEQKNGGHPLKDILSMNKLLRSRKKPFKKKA